MSHALGRQRKAIRLPLCEEQSGSHFSAADDNRAIIKLNRTLA